MNILPKVNTLEARLNEISQAYDPVSFASSFSLEDMVLTDVICKLVPKIGVFTLDTGRLPQETYTLMHQVKDTYGDVVKVFFPHFNTVEKYTNAHGPNAFYNSIELRKSCCSIRKLEPLARALSGHQAWITGLRREQSTTRTETQLQEWDEARQMPKFNPLFDWNSDEIWQYIHQFKIPYNALFEQQYASIGCAPCTRAISASEHARDGRWWWENPDTKECGLHSTNVKSA